MPELLTTDVDALCARIPNGASVILTKGEMPDTPFALALAMIRARLNGLHLVTLPACAQPVSGMCVDILIGAGVVASVETSGISLGELGAAPRFNAAAKAGTIKLIDATCPAVYAAVQAGGKSQPFTTLRGVIGSDLVEHRDDWKIIPNPFDADDPVLVIKAINPDFALLHVRKVDRLGNLWIGRNRDQLYAAHAAKSVLVTTEEIVDTNFYDDETMAAGVIPAFYVDAIAHAPTGALPIGAKDDRDLDPVRAYAATARSEAGFADWLAAQGLRRTEAAE